MITLKHVTEYPQFDAGGSPTGHKTLTALIELDGQQWSVGGIAPTLGKEEIRQLLEARQPELLAAIQGGLASKSIERAELADESELQKAKAQMDYFLALPPDQWTQAKAIEAIKFLLKVQERVVRYLVKTIQS